MPANVETMFYSGREKPWHGLGVMVEEAPTSADALRLAGLDWMVEQESISVYNKNERIPNYRANIRSSDGSVLGVVTDRYVICQNTEAFEFTDNIVGGEVHYETAGSLRNGKAIWLLAKMPDTKILGDKIEPYMCFTNTHDGTGAIRVCMTPIRVVCNNTLNIAFAGATRQWSTRHMGNIEEKMHQAEKSLELADEYMENLDKYAEQLANTSITEEKIKEVLDDLFPIKETDTDRKKANAKQMKDEYMICYFAPDIAKFMGTAWGAVNAMSDMVAHTAPQRNTSNYQENNWGRIMDGHVLLDRMVELVGVR